MSSHVIRHYFTMGDATNDPPLGAGDETSIIIDKPEQGNKHQYFLRAKTARLTGHHPVSGEDEEFKNSSPSLEKGMKSSKKRASPLPSSKSDHFEDYSAASSEDEDLANCLVMLSSKSYALPGEQHKEESKGKQVVEKGMFQCKACKKMFNSHQALGGHRASHKKVKGCFAAKLDDEENVGDDSIQEYTEHMTASGSDPPRTVSTTSARKKTKMHECSVCHRVFSSGQALGGHKRCHWLTTSTDNAFIPSFQDFQYDHKNQQLCQKPMFTIPRHDKEHHQLDLNLNLPAPQHEIFAADDSTGTLEASTRFFLQQQLATASHNQQGAAPSTTANDIGQKGCEMNKLRKLSDLRDVNHGGSGWLQMGTAPTPI